MELFIDLLVLSLVAGLVVGGGIFVAMQPNERGHKQCEGNRDDAYRDDRKPRVVFEDRARCAMRVVNLAQAKSSLSRLVLAVETGQEREIAIARDNRLVAKLVAIDAPTTHRRVRIGLAKGQFEIPDTIDTCNEEIARLFHDKP